MKTLIIIITLCGKPDAVIVREVGMAPVYMNWASIIRSESNSSHFIELVEDSERIIVDHTNGICA